MVQKGTDGSCFRELLVPKTPPKLDALHVALLGSTILKTSAPIV